MISGKDKSASGQPPKRGTVLAAYPKENKVLVEGVNVLIKHQKEKAHQSARRQQRGAEPGPYPAGASRKSRPSLSRK